MDSGKKIGGLDPKLQEAYERVMKTTVAPPPPAAASKSDGKPETVVVGTPSASSKGSSFSVYKAGGVLKAKKGGGIPTFLLVILGIIFFVVYAFIWIKVLNLKVPFLP